MIPLSESLPYVVAAYAVAVVSLVAYFGSLRTRARREKIERSR